MKKKLLSLLLAVSLCMGIQTTVMAAENAFQTEDSVLPESRYSSMWVGDRIQINTDSFTYEVTEGSENVKLDLTNDTLEFVKEGTTKIAVASNDGTDTTETYTFTITPAEEAYVEYEIPQSVKVGYTVGNSVLHVGDSKNAYVYYNCLFGSRYGNMYSMSDLHSYGYINGGWVDPFFPDTETRQVTGYWAMAFTRPGTTYIKIDGIEPYAITIEEPVISTNLPKRVQVGSSMQMTTSLDNTMLEDKEISEIRNRGLYDLEAAIGYQPTVEIVSGADLVKRENGDYSNILSTSEDITFTGEGTVTFKVTYDMLPFEKVQSGENVYVNDEVYYSPEATFSVDVVSELPSASITDKTEDSVTVDASGLDADKICAENNVNTSNNDVDIVISQTDAAKEDIAKIEQMSNKENYSVQNTYEILMTLFADGNKVSDITENFGTLKLRLFAGKSYAGQNVRVYQLHNGTEIITHDDLKVDENGFVDITVDKLSTFAVAVKNDKTEELPANPITENNSTNGNTTISTKTESSDKSDIPQTGDIDNLFVWVILIAGSLGAALVVLIKKYLTKTNL